MASVSTPPASDMITSSMSTACARQPQGERRDQLDVAAAHRAEREGDRRTGRRRARRRRAGARRPARAAGRSPTRRGWRASAMARLSQLGMVRDFEVAPAARRAASPPAGRAKSRRAPLPWRKALDGVAFQTVTGGHGKCSDRPARASGRRRVPRLDGAGRLDAAPDGLAAAGRREARAAACSSPAGAATSSRNISRPTPIGTARGWNVTAFDWRGQGGSRGDRRRQSRRASIRWSTISPR